MKAKYSDHYLRDVIETARGKSLGQHTMDILYDRGSMKGIDTEGRRAIEVRIHELIEGQ